jgi:protoporphyrinogen oxidase
VTAERIGVIGGGALGLAAALRLAQAGRAVTVIEREAELGGLAAGFRPGVDSAATLEKFYHHLFRTDRTATRLIEELGLGGRLLWGRPVTASLIDGRAYHMPAGLLSLASVPIAERLRFAAMMAALKLAPSERPFRGSTAAAWTRRWTGDRAYAALIAPLLRGKFGARADEIAMSWLWSRFHERSLSLGYLRGGFQQLYDALGERIRALSGEILLGTAATSIRSENGSVHVETQQGQLRFDRLLVTTPQRVFERLAEGLPSAYRERYPGPAFYDAHVLILALERPLTQQYWISIGDPSFPFLVLVEHTNFLPASDYGGRHLIYLGNYLPPDAPLLKRSADEVLQEYLPALARFNPAFEPAWVQQHWLFHAPFAQPIVTRNYLASLPPIRTPLANVYLATMAHVYPQDRGQNYSLALGERLACRMLRNR